MYESKLGTEKNTQIMKIEAPNSKPRIFREPSPRIEEKIKIMKKRNDYLDNYQYKESKVYRNPDKKRRPLVEHIRLGEIIDGFFETITYKTQTINHEDSRQRRIRDNSKKDKLKLSKTFHTGFRDSKSEKKESKRNASSRSLHNPQPSQEKKYTTTTTTVNRRTKPNILDNTNINTKTNKNTKIPPRTRQNIKSDIITNIIAQNREPKQPPKVEYQINTYNPRSRQPKEPQPKKTEKNYVKSITRTVVQKDDNKLKKNNSTKKIEPTNRITSISVSKRNTGGENNDNLKSKTPKKREDIKIDDNRSVKKTRKIIELSKDDKKPKAIIEIVKLEKKDESKPKKIIEIVKIESTEEKKPKKISESNILKKEETTTTKLIIESKEEKPIKKIDVKVEDEIVQPGKRMSIRNRYKTKH